MDEYVDCGKVSCAVDVKLYIIVNCSLISKEPFEYADRIKAYR